MSSLSLEKRRASYPRATSDILQLYLFKRALQSKDGALLSLNLKYSLLLAFSLKEVPNYLIH